MIGALWAGLWLWVLWPVTQGLRWLREVLVYRPLVFLGYYEWVDPDESEYASEPVG